VKGTGFSPYINPSLSRLGFSPRGKLLKTSHDDFYQPQKSHCHQVSSQSIADNSPLEAENKYRLKTEDQMTAIQSPTRAIPVPSPLVPGPGFSVYLLRFFAKKTTTPHPPYPVKPHFLSEKSCNIHSFNHLYFQYVNQSVTANPAFCPIFSPENRLFYSKSALFRRIRLAT
jgi:hypothetical protein